MTKISDDFEKQIARIHSLLEGSNAKVTWNDQIKDPDNLKQYRQIDFSIRNKNSFIIGECRFHLAKQDVQWIEELIGRRFSLQADGAIAVSASGFTEGAIRKAEAYGIITRNFIEITDEELATWGKKTIVSTNFVRLDELAIEFSITSSFDEFNTFTNSDGQPIHFFEFFQRIVRAIEDTDPEKI